MVAAGFWRDTFNERQAALGASPRAERWVGKAVR